MSDRKWYVLVFNDDATPMEFVAYSLQRVFQKDADDAERTMLDTHQHGIAICAAYDRLEDAVSKVAEARSLAREHGHPLQLRYACGDAGLGTTPSRMKGWFKRIDERVWKAFWQGE